MSVYILREQGCGLRVGWYPAMSPGFKYRVSYRYSLLLPNNTVSPTGRWASTVPPTSRTIKVINKVILFMMSFFFYANDKSLIGIYIYYL